MKRCLLWLCLPALMLLSACSTSETGPDLQEWLQSAALTREQTKEELYALAKEEDVLHVYSVSTRMMEVVEAFEAAYPGLLVEVSDLRGDRLVSDVQTTIDNGSFDCDVMFLTDVNGVLSGNFVPNGYAYQYVPHDFSDKLIPIEGKEELMPLFTEAIFIHYNPAIFPEQPIDNWWELTDERWRGKVYAPTPTQSVTTLAMYNMLIKHDDLMEEAYAAHYGEPFVSENGESAAETFIRRLVDNDLHIVNSSDEVSDAVGLPGSEEALGLMVSSKLRLNKIGYQLAFATDVAPFDGVASSVHILVAGGAQNINTAKLFIRFIFGETDGTGAGYLPYLQDGAWSMRTDVQSEESTPLDSLNLVYSDEGYTYQNQDAFFAFWEQLLQ